MKKQEISKKRNNHRDDSLKKEFVIELHQKGAIQENVDEEGLMWIARIIAEKIIDDGLLETSTSEASNDDVA